MPAVFPQGELKAIDAKGIKYMGFFTYHHNSQVTRPREASIFHK